VIGTDGVIAYAEVNPDDTRRADSEELLPVLSEINKSSERQGGRPGQAGAIGIRTDPMKNVPHTSGQGRSAESIHGR
jgi:hypothetical protein